MKTKFVLTLSALALLAAACGGTTQVGDDDITVGGGGRLGEIVNSKSAEASPSPTKTQKKQNEPKEGEKEPAEEQVAISVSIAAEGFDPSLIRVFEGSIVKFTNNDSAARSVRADTGEFDSGDITPGKSWFYTANIVGRFGISDGTRPYVVGTLEVLPK